MKAIYTLILLLSMCSITFASESDDDDSGSSTDTDVENTNHNSNNNRNRNYNRNNNSNKASANARANARSSSSVQNSSRNSTKNALSTGANIYKSKSYSDGSFATRGDKMIKVGPVAMTNTSKRKMYMFLYTHVKDKQAKFELMCLMTKKTWTSKHPLEVCRK